MSDLKTAKVLFGILGMLLAILSVAAACWAPVNDEIRTALIVQGFTLSGSVVTGFMMRRTTRAPIDDAEATIDQAPSRIVKKLPQAPAAPILPPPPVLQAPKLSGKRLR